MIHKKIN